MYLSDTVLGHVEQVSDAPDLSGTRYELKERIGKGGMATVWLAHDRELGRDVAVKVAAVQHAREAQVIAQLEHPGIVPVHDAGVLPDGRGYYVMKRVRGERLDVWARGRELRAKLKLFERICETIAFAHARAVLHRDLKPENVMVGEFGEALVMDWGLARHEPGPAGTTVAAGRATLAGAVMGTPSYMAPEQARGEPVSAAADVYGLGALLYALLAGRPPYVGDEVLAQVRAGPPPPLREQPPALAAVCAKAMAREPAERYASAAELGDDVARFLALEPVRARREPLLEKAARFVSKNRVVLSLLGAYLLVRLALAWLS